MRLASTSYVSRQPNRNSRRLAIWDRWDALTQAWVDYGPDPSVEHSSTGFTKLSRCLEAQNASEPIVPAQTGTHRDPGQPRTVPFLYYFEEHGADVRLRAPFVTGNDFLLDRIRCAAWRPPRQLLEESL